MAAHDPDDLLLIGRIVDAHGLKGDLKVAPETDDPERVASLSTVYIGMSPDTAQSFDLLTARAQPSKYGVTLVLRLAGFSDRTAAERMKGQRIYAETADLPPLADDELYVHDLIGLAVTDEEGTPIGTLKDVMDLPAHPVYVVAGPAGDVLVPAVPEFVVSIDMDAGRMVIRAIEGLLE